MHLHSENAQGGTGPLLLSNAATSRRRGSVSVECRSVHLAPDEVRGADLLEFTGAQVQIWQAFGATPPAWTHAPLILDADARKISKSEGGIGIYALRDAGWTADQVWRALLPWLGLSCASLNEATAHFNPTAGPLGPVQLRQAPGLPDQALDWLDTRVSGRDTET